MSRRLSEFKIRKKQRTLLTIFLVMLVLFFFCALMRIGVGEAEWAGMTVSNLTPTLAVEFNIQEGEKGVVVNWVEGPAYYCGVQEGDFLKAINSKKTEDIKEFLSIAKNVDINNGALLDILRDRQPLFITLENKVGLHGKVKQALGMESTTSYAADSNSAMTNVAFSKAMALGNLPTPTEQKASGKILVEGHWLGMELIPLTAELAKEYHVPPDTKGLLVDEISLEAAESGILAGDMLVAIDGISTPDVAAFTEATRRVKNKKSAKMLVSRRGQLLQLTISSDRALGFSQNEAAQPILPGAISPHRSRNKPCTACHIIMASGGQLPTDAGDILPNPPPLKKGTQAFHEYRGACKNCHVILKK